MSILDSARKAARKETTINRTEDKNKSKGKTQSSILDSAYQATGKTRSRIDTLGAAKGGDYVSATDNTYKSFSDRMKQQTTISSDLSDEERKSRIDEIDSELFTLKKARSGLERAKLYGGVGDTIAQNEARQAELLEEKKRLERVGTVTGADKLQWAIDDAQSEVYEANREVAKFGSRPSPTAAEEYREAVGEAFKAQQKLDNLEKEKTLYKDIEQSGDVVHKDNFGGQFAANYRVSDLMRDADKAMSLYMDNPTEENKQIAYAYDALVREYQENNKLALDENEQVLPWISKSAAGYLPQFFDQIAPQAIGGGVGGILGSAVGMPTLGASLGSGIATGGQSYNVMRGSVYRTLLAEGVDESIAREAANDEALISALIEGGETAISFGIAGGGKAISAIGTAAAKSVAKGSTNVGTKFLAGLATKGVTKAAEKAAASAVAKPIWQKGLSLAGGIVANGASEYGEEFLQEGVSIANKERAMQGKTGKLNLVGKAAGTTWDAVTGKDPEALAQMHAAGKEGGKIGLLFGGTQTITNNVIAHYANAKTIAEENEVLDEIIASDDDLDTIIEQGKASGEGTVSARIAEEVEEAKEKGEVTREQVKSLIESTKVYVEHEQQIAESETLEDAAREAVERRQTGTPLAERLEAMSEANEPLDIEDVKKVTSFGENGARLVAELAGNEGVTFSQATKAVETAYQAGYTDLDAKQASFETDTQINAFTAGKQDRQMKDIANREAAKKASVYDTGFTENEYSAKLTDGQREVISVLAKDLKMDVEVVDKVVAAVVNGIEYEANAYHQDGKIEISSSLEEGKTVAGTAVHEGFHRVKQLAPDEFKTLANFIYNSLPAEERSARYDLTKAEHDAAGIEMDSDDIIEEIAVRSIEKKLKNPEEFLKFRESVEANPKAKSAWQKVWEAIIKVLQDIKAIINGSKLDLDTKRKALAEADRLDALMRDAYKAAVTAADKRMSEVKNSQNDGGNVTSEGYNGKVSYSGKYWHTDLTEPEMITVMEWLRKAGKPEAKQITDTAYWYKGRIGGDNLFVIYSYQDTDPTILYETKGNNAKAELDVLQRAVEVTENERSAVEKSRIIDEILSGNWVRQEHNLANNDDRLGGTGSDIGYAPILQGKSSEFIGSEAFRNVVKNLFEIQKAQRASIEEGLNGSKNYSLKKKDIEYLELAKNPEKNDARLREMVAEAAKKAMPKSLVVDKNGNLLKVYHGSAKKFTEFLHKYLNAHGNSHGRGFYFTENKALAEGYATDDGQLLEGYLNIEKPLSEDKVTIKKSDLVKLIKATCEAEAKTLVEEGYSNTAEALRDTWVSNYTDTYSANSMADVYREVADIVYSANDNDVEIIAELTNAGAGNESVLTLTRDILGYDGVIFTNDLGHHEFVSLTSEQFKSADPVTYDNNGNIIPLSERFNSEKTDIRYSLKGKDDYTQAYELQVEINQLDDKLAEMQKGEDFTSAMAEMSKAIGDGDTEKGIAVYNKWLSESGYSETRDKRDALQTELDKLRKAQQAAYEKESSDAEQTAIEKSGLSEADYFRKQAVKEFGYTPFFYDAGYITPNGKMLNFSGEKGQHFGSRGQDHRAIGTIYANTSGGAAMVRFIGEGNIRIMAESPGIDISSDVAPTAEQYATIRRFAREYAKEGYFAIDFTNAEGYTVANYEYDGKVNPDRVVNDIKYYFENGTTREQSTVSQFRSYSLKGNIKDSAGNTLSQEQQSYFSESKERDKNGNLKVMYRGDPNEINVFDRKKSKPSNLYGRGFYFTDSKSRAEQYGKSTAYYLNIKNPLSPGQKNITRAQLQRFLEAIENNGEDYDLYNYGEGATAKSVLPEVWGKGDFEMLQDINASAVGDFVATIELFNEVNGTNYDGIILPSETVIFNSEQAKLTTNKNPTANPDTRYSLKSPKKGKNEYAPTFYSHMSKTVDGMKDGKIGANSVVSYLKGKGVKNEEIKWSGIETFLEGKKSVTKAELQEFVAGNQLEIEEDARDKNTKKTLKDKYHIEGTSDVQKLYYNGKLVETFTNDDGDWFSSSDEYITSNKNKILTDYLDNEKSLKWGSYKLDGGKNYREILFKLPNSEYSNDAMRIHWGDGAKGILAHARLQDFKVNGKKMLFIEEIQSDLHNEGHTQGYIEKGQKTTQGILNESADAFREFVNSDIINSIISRMQYEGHSKAVEVISELFEGNESAYRDVVETIGGLTSEEKAFIDNTIALEKQRKKQHESALPDRHYVPDAPFRDNYHEFVLKRLIREAAENGYDSIGWTTADIQSKRWSDKFAEGYRIEYDQDIPKFLNKYGKKWGATVGSTVLKNGEEVWSMDITDAMKESVLYEGQAQYSLKKNNGTTAADTQELLDTISQLKHEFEITRFAKADPKKLAELTKDILKDYESKYDYDSTFAAVDELYTYMANGEDGHPAVWSDVHDRAYAVAKDIVESAVAIDDSAYNEYKELRRYLHNVPMKFDSKYDSVPSAYNNFNDFRKKNFGRLRFNNDGISVDAVYQELAEMYPQFFDADNEMTTADQLERIVDVLDGIQPMEVNPFAADMKEVTYFVANDIINRFFDVPQAKPTFADKAARKLTETKIADRKKLDYVREQRDIKIQNLKSKYKQIIAKARASKTDAIAKEKTKHRDRLAKMSESRKAAELRTRIFKHTTELNQKLLHGTDKNHIPQELQGAVLVLLESINLESNIEYVYGTDANYHRVKAGTVLGAEPTKKTKAFSALKDIYSAMEGKATIDPDLLGAEGMLSEVIQLADKRIADMTSAELNTVWEAVRAVEASVLYANKMFSAGKYEKISEIAESLKSDNAGKNVKKELRFGGGLQSLATLNMMTPETYMHYLGSAGDAMFRMMRNAQDKHISIMKEVADFTHEACKGIDINKLEKKLITVKLGGRDVRLTTAQIMELYVLNKREQAKEHIFTGGILPDAIDNQGLFKIKEAEPIRGITQEELGKVLAVLTEEQKAVADKLQKFVSVVLSKHGNEASMQVYNYEKFNEENYWTIRTNKQEIASDIEKDNAVTTVANKGMAKGTKPHANTSLRIGSIFDTFAAHSSDMATYAAWLGTTEDINRIRNFVFWEDGARTGTVKGVLDTVHGSQGSDYLHKLLTDISIGVKGVDNMNPFEKLTGAYKAASVGANIRVIIQQPTAILRALDLIDGQYLAGGAAELPLAIRGWNKAKKYAPIAQWKDWGHFDINTGRQMKDVLFDNASLIENLKQLGMWGASTADSLTWGVLWNAVELETKATRKDLPKGTEAFYQACAERFTEIVDHTQVVDGILQRSQIMRSKSDVVKMATSFMGEPTKQYNMVMQAAYDATTTKGKAKKKAIGRLGRTAMSLVVAGVINAMAQSVIDALRDDDKEKKYWEKWLASCDDNLKDTANPLGYVPFVKDIVSIYQGYDVKRMDTESITKTFNAATNMYKAVTGTGKYTVAEASANLFAEIARMGGVPVANVKRDIKSIATTYAIQSDNYLMQYRMEKAMLNMNYSGNRKNFMDILYNAYVNDKEAYEIIYNDLLKNGYDADIIQNGMETRMKKAEGTTKVSELSKRYMSPETEKAYNSKLKAIQTSRLWKSADTTQRKAAETTLYDFIASDSNEMVEKRTEARAYGVDETEYVLWQLAREMADEAGNDNGSLDAREKADALGKLELGDKEITYFYNTKEADEAYANKIDMMNYAMFKSAVSGLKGDDKKDKVEAYAKEFSDNEKEKLYFMGTEYSSWQKRADYKKYFK